MVEAVYCLPISGLMAQTSGIGPGVDGHLAQFCIHYMNWVNSYNSFALMTAL